MNNIFETNQISAISADLQNQDKRIVLVGGCFDILHIGHITFLQTAKEQGDFLLVLLESDATITQTKGSKRPINTQEDRAKILAALSVVDAVILLKPQMTNQDYDDLVIALKPAIIATTKGDANKQHKERQAQLVAARVVDVTEQISDKSTTQLIQLLNEL